VNKAENNEQFDTDILQCKVDILRARNIIPGEITPKNPETQNSTVETTQSSHKNISSIPVEEIPAKETPPLLRSVIIANKKEEAEIPQEKSEIPSFNLAEEIMAEQRKITAIRRKAPGQKTDALRLKPEPQIDDHIIEQSKSLLSEQEKIIAEIVAKDIEKLCRGDYLANNK
jgi:hypothetical protein